MTLEEFGEELEFEEVRQLSPQWLVKYRQSEIAIVTERYIKEPKYVVTLSFANKEEEYSFNTRDEVMNCLFDNLKHIVP